MAKKRFLGYDANGTDGSNRKLMSALVEVVDNDGFTGVLRVPAERFDLNAEDADIREELRKKPIAEDVGLH